MLITLNEKQPYNNNRQKALVVYFGKIIINCFTGDTTVPLPRSLRIICFCGLELK